MDTSKDCYESVMLQFRTYGRGRTLEQFCRDEGADFKWIEKAADLYGTPEKEKGSPEAPDAARQRDRDNDVNPVGRVGTAGDTYRTLMAVERFPLAILYKINWFLQLLYN